MSGGLGKGGGDGDCASVQVDVCWYGQVEALLPHTGQPVERWGGVSKTEDDAAACPHDKRKAGSLIEVNLREVSDGQLLIGLHGAVDGDGFLDDGLRNTGVGFEELGCEA